MKTLKQLQEIIGKDIKSDYKTLDPKAFFQKHGKKKSEVSSFVSEAKEKSEYDYEGDMARGQLQSIVNNAQKVHDMLKDNDNLPEWVQSKITLAEDYISTVANYMMSEVDEAVEEETMDEMAGANMDVRQVHKHLKKSGWSLTRTSGGHDVYTHPKSTEHIAVPRHRSLKAPLVLGIMKTAKKVSEETEQLEEGRPSQQHPLEGHEYHKKSDAELKYIAKDAHEAAEAMKSHGTESGRRAENKYRDQASDSATVRYFRKKSGMPDWYKKKYGHVKEEVELDEVNKLVSLDSIKKELLKKPSKKKPQGADFAAERRKERLAKNGRMDEASSRKAQIVKSAAKKDKFIADPIITNTNVKADGDQK